MDYELLLNEIINIGKEMIKSGAETNRVEDSMVSYAGELRYWAV